MQHEWVPTTFRKPTGCGYCGSMIMGVVNQGVICRCGQACHHECSEKDKFCHSLPQTGRQHLPKTTSFKQLTWCNVCRKLLQGLTKQGLRCTDCGLIYHSTCQAGETCKPSRFGQTYHHWVEGNLRSQNQDKFCVVCEKKFPVTCCLANYYCTLCLTTVHTTCLNQIENERCDGGEFTSLPLLCFVNPKSGGGQGDVVFRQLRKHLNPDRVFALGPPNPTPADVLNQFRETYFDILVCGGDGSAAWLLETIRKMDPPLQHQPRLAIIPCGTGNDLARVLGFGPGYNGEPVEKILRQVVSADTVQLDRWQVRRHGELHTVMNNYFSFGIDAHVLNEFHNEREANPERFTSRAKGKAVYAKHSLKALNSQVLNGQVTVWADDILLDISELQGVLIASVPSYAAGSNIWKSELPQSFSDGLLEIVGIKGISHMAGVVAGIRSTICLAQARRIVIEIADEVCVQVDGEPWVEDRSTLTIEFLEQVPMLSTIAN